jgi:hypothetical protein
MLALQREPKRFGPGVWAKTAIVLLTSVWFGLGHYSLQGLAGVEQGTIVGLVFGTIFAVTGRIWMLMFAHAAFDLTARDHLLESRILCGSPRLQIAREFTAFRREPWRRSTWCKASSQQRGLPMIRSGGQASGARMAISRTPSGSSRHPAKRNGSRAGC